MKTGKDTLSYELHGNCYINLTNRCTLRCSFCPKFNKQWEVQGYPLRLQAEPDARQILHSIGSPEAYSEIVFCGLGEPTLQLAVLLEIAREIKKQNIRIRLNTDGLANHVYREDITPQLAGLIDAVSISMNAHNARIYNLHCRPPATGLWPAMLEFVACVKQHVPEVTLTAIDELEGVDIEACRQLAAELEVKFRRRVLHEVG